MSKASEVVLDLVSRPLTPEQILARQEAERPRTGLVGTLDGRLVEPETSKPVMQAPVQTTD
jgi:hypothetical protein